MVWDGIMCWDASPPGKLQIQSCPDYVHGFDPQGKQPFQSPLTIFMPEIQTLVKQNF